MLFFGVSLSVNECALSLLNECYESRSPEYGDEPDACLVNDLQHLYTTHLSWRMV